MTIQAGAVDKAPRISDSLRRLLNESLNIVQGQFELFKLDLGDERTRLGNVMTRGVLAGLLIFMTVQLFALLAVALSWDTQWRIPVIVGLAVTSLVATLLAIRTYKATPASSLFESSVDELHKNVRAIEGSK